MFVEFLLQNIKKIVVIVWLFVYMLRVCTKQAHNLGLNVL